MRKPHLTQSVAFDFVRYANVWEDAAILLEALRPSAGSRILSIASAGDNCFALLLADPELVAAADLNPAQFHLIELKMATLRRLDHPDALAFLGFREMKNRAAIFEKLKTELSADARNFWQNRADDLAAGVIHAGKFERYFQLFARRVLPLIHSRRTTAALLSQKSAAEQGHFYHENWNTWRWRGLFKIFFSKWAMGRFGRDPEFLAQVEVPVGERIFQSAERHLQSVAAQQNHILRYNLTGDFGTLLPDFLLPQNFEIIRQRLDRIQFFRGYAQDAGASFGKFDAMNLSDIFEYMDAATFRSVADSILKISNPGCRIGYWNLLVPRRVSQVLPERVEFLEKLSSELTTRDRGFFYEGFFVDRVR